jgi:hypothetical protein
VNRRRTSRAGANVEAAGGVGVAVGSGVAVGGGVVVGNGVAVGGGGVVGTAVAVGVGVTPEGAGVSTVMTGAVAVGSAALLGGEVAVAVGREPGVDVGRMRITRGVGVAVTSAADTCNACGAGAMTARPVRTTAAMIPVRAPCRRVADVTALGTVLQSWRPGLGSMDWLFASWSRLRSHSGSGEDLELRLAPGECLHLGHDQHRIADALD